MKILSLIAISGITILGFNNALASDISYTYAEIGYNAYDEVSTVNIGGSFAINDQFNAIANIEVAEVDYGYGITGAIAITELGLGAHTAISPKTDAFATLSYTDSTATVDAVADHRSISISTSGYSLGAGVRHKFTEQLEGHLKIKHMVFSEVDISSTTFTGGGRFDFTPNIGVGLDLSTDDEESFATTSLRYSTL